METPNVLAKRILIVEDEPVIGKMCQRVLSDEGFEVDIAVNGKLAQDMIGRRTYALFLIDIRMPLVNGRELYEWLEKRHPQLLKKVILMSGDVMGGDTKDFLEKSGQLILPKPFTTDDLTGIVMKALNTG